MTEATPLRRQNYTSNVRKTSDSACHSNFALRSGYLSNAPVQIRTERNGSWTDTSPPMVGHFNVLELTINSVAINYVFSQILS